MKRLAHRASSSSRQRAVSVGAVVWGLAFLVVALGSERGLAEVPIGVHAGYAFRVTDQAVDDRAHGAAASVLIDSPPLLWGFGLRAEGVALAWGGTRVRPDALAILGGGLALTYLFDDTAVQALASIGGVGGVVVEGVDIVPASGPSAGLLLRFPLGEAAAIEGRLLLPLLMGDERFSLQATALIGISVFPDVLVAGALAGRHPWQLVLPGYD